MIAHFEELADRSRHDLAAFGRAADELDESTTAPTGDRSAAMRALARASGVIEFAPDQKIAS
jgi:hypothetical protein